MRRWLGAVVLVALVVAACGGDDGDSERASPEGGTTATATGDDDAGSGEASGEAVDPSLCGLEALAAADSAVTIEFWHNQTDTNLDVLEGFVDEFHAAQDDVRVELTQFPDYEALFQRFRAGLGTGDLPDLAVMEETTLQVLVDSEATVPVQACVDADGYDLSDYLPRAISYYTTQDVLRAMPWNVSNPIFFYEKGAFEDAGLDPEDPPDTLEEVRDYATQIVDSGAATHGMSLKAQDHYVEFWHAKGGELYVNNENGRAGRATAAELDTEFGLELWTWWDEMVDSGLALSTAAGAENIDHLLAIGNGEAAMTIEGSGAIGPILAVLESGQFPGVEIGAGPLPGLVPGGGVPVGDGALWLTASDPAKRAAAWELMKFLNEPPQQVRLHLDAGFVPIRISAAEDPEVLAAWSEMPVLRVAYDQLVEGPEIPATAGSVIGDYQGVRDAVGAGLEEMLIGGASPADALAGAQAAADAAIAAYNDRIGG